MKNVTCEEIPLTTINLKVCSLCGTPADRPHRPGDCKYGMNDDSREKRQPSKTVEPTHELTIRLDGHDEPTETRTEPIIAMDDAAAEMRARARSRELGSDWTVRLSRVGDHESEFLYKNGARW